MAHDQNTYQFRKNRSRVREVLHREWDPIGVHGIPLAKHEYDIYADRAFAMLMIDRASAGTIAIYLFRMATENMGLTHYDDLAERAEHVAKRLVDLRLEFEAS